MQDRHAEIVLKEMWGVGRQTQRKGSVLTKNSLLQSLNNN